MANLFSVYVLLKDKNPVYIGCTQDIPRRINQHKKSKDFDCYKVVKSYKDRDDAYLAENAILRYESLFNLSNLKNSKDKSLEGWNNFLNNKNG